MSATVTQAYVEPQPSPFSEIYEPLAAPAKTIAPSSPRNYDGIELQHMPSNRGDETPVPGPSVPASPASTPPNERNDLEMSRPPSPAPGEVVEAEPSAWDPPMNKWRLLSVCLANLGNGLGDSAAGALIPYMEKYYNIGYGVVSLIFVGQALGFVFSAAFIDTLRQKTGRAGLLGVGQGLMVLGFIPVIAGAPWALVACSFFCVGFGLAINVAMGNTFCGSLRNGTFLLGLLHGSYGIGGTAGPLMATALVTAANAVFSRYYLITAGLGLVTLSMCVWSFWNFEKELSPAQRARESPAEGKSAIMGMLGAMKLRTVLLGSTFIFAYQGAEVSISGWVISFLIQARDGDPSTVGYVSSGFWAGITIGRFVLSIPAQRIGEKRFVYFLTVGALLFQILVWWVPNIVGNAVAVSIVGLMLGPIYPCAAAVCLRTMSRRDALSGMSTISAFGSLGGAIAPFITGLLAQAVGVWILHPIVIFLCLVMLLCWWGVPTTAKRDD